MVISMAKSPKMCLWITWAAVLILAAGSNWKIYNMSLIQLVFLVYNILCNQELVGNNILINQHQQLRSVKFLLYYLKVTGIL